ACGDPAAPREAKRELAGSLFGGKVGPGSVDALLAIVGHQRLKGREIVEVTEGVAQQCLLDDADAAGQLDAVEDELFRFARLVDGTPELRSALTDPALPGARKRAVVEELLAGRSTRAAAAVLAHLAEQDRARNLTAVVEAIVVEAAARRQRVVAEVRTAVALDDDQRSRLLEALGRVTGKPVDL